MNTTENEAPQPSRRHRPRQPTNKGAAAVAGILGCLLLALGVPSLIAAVRTLGARAVVWDVYAGAPVPPESLIDAAAALTAGGIGGREGELVGDAGLLLLKASAAAPTLAESEERLAAAAAASVSALSIAPGQPGVWARLAYLRMRGGEQPEALAALRLSMLSGSFVPAMMKSRIELGVRLLPAMDRETLGLLQRQIRLTWVVDPEYIAALSMRPDLAPLVGEALDGLTEQEMKQVQRLHGQKR